MSSENQLILGIPAPYSLFYLKEVSFLFMNHSPSMVIISSHRGSIDKERNPNLLEKRTAESHVSKQR